MLPKRKRSSESLVTLATFDPAALPCPVPIDVSSRTMKRYRNNRPSDDEVHRKFYEWRAHHQNETPSSSCPPERTLNMLYTAQQDINPIPPQQQQALDLSHEQQAAAAAISGQSSLHRFWNINSTPTQQPAASSIPSSLHTSPSSCEDCGAGLLDGGMDVDGALEATTCGACGKHVCFSCSVSNLGEQKRCLQCAGRKVWVGGLGWTSVPVC